MGVALPLPPAPGGQAPRLHAHRAGAGRALGRGGGVRPGRRAAAAPPLRPPDLADRRRPAAELGPPHRPDPRRLPVARHAGGSGPLRRRPLHGLRPEDDAGVHPQQRGGAARGARRRAVGRAERRRRGPPAPTARPRAGPRPRACRRTPWSRWSRRPTAASGPAPTARG